MCELGLTLGTNLTPSGGILPSGSGIRLCKAVDVLQDRSLPPGVRAVGQEGEAWPEVVLDGMGLLGFIVELSRWNPDTGAVDAAGIGGLYRFF